MWSAAFSPTIIDGALRLPLVIRGKIELSATPGFDLDHPALGVDDRERVGGGAEAGGAAGVEGALDLLADEGVELGVGLHLRPRLDLVAGVGAESGLREDSSRVRRMQWRKSTRSRSSAM